MTMKHAKVSCLAMIVATALFASASIAADTNSVKVFILAGQSNMEGKAPNALLDHQATDAKTRDLFAHFRKGDQWIVRDDVFVKFLDRHGGLTIGYGSRDRTGVELEFGTVMGNHFEEPVLLIKTAWGGHSLFKMFRPPSAGMPSDEELQKELDQAQERVRKDNEKNKKNAPLPTLDDIKAPYGSSYRNMLTEVKTVSEKFETLFPTLKGRKLEIAGFVWFQGWNDQYGAENEYASHMEHFIRDIRKDLGTPNLPFVIGVMGQNGSKPAKGAMLTIQKAQLAMNDIPDFQGNVRAIRTDVLVDQAAETLYPEWKTRTEEWKLTGGDHPYHYLGSAIWFNRIGKAMGEAMLELMQVPPPVKDAARASSAPDTRAVSPIMLAGPWVPEDSQRIDFDKLPRVASEHVVVSNVRDPASSPKGTDKKRGGVNQHNYLAHHDGKFWLMWSDGPGIEDRVGQRVKFASSPDGLTWSTSRFLSPVPPDSGPESPHYGTRTDKGFRYISRGFWKRDGELLALASLDEAAGFFGKSLELRAFRLHAADESWHDAGVVARDAINNFPPMKLRTGDWLMSRRAHDYKTTGVHFLVGGVPSLDQWESFPVLGSSSELKAEEPDWWILPDQTLAAVFRDNGGSGFLHRAFSSDNGRTWTTPVKTNFPDATSKVCGLRLSDGRYVLVSNPKPKRRDPLTLAISDDGIVFRTMIFLVGGRHVDYPHVIEHEGALYIAFAGGKQTVEVLKVKLADLDAVTMPMTQLRHALPAAS
jgi:hypothetical protein